MNSPFKWCIFLSRWWTYLSSDVSSFSDDELTFQVMNLPFQMMNSPSFLPRFCRFSLPMTNMAIKNLFWFRAKSTAWFRITLPRRKMRWDRRMRWWSGNVVEWKWRKKGWWSERGERKIKWWSERGERGAIDRHHWISVILESESNHLWDKVITEDIENSAWLDIDMIWIRSGCLVLTWSLSSNYMHVGKVFIGVYARSSSLAIMYVLPRILVPEREKWRDIWSVSQAWGP